jgi:hypothetical protein
MIVVKFDYFKLQAKETKDTITSKAKDGEVLSLSGEPHESPSGIGTTGCRIT